MNWCDLCEVIIFWNEVSYGDVLGVKSTVYITVNVYWGYWIVLWLFFSTHGSVLHMSMLIKIQPDAKVCRYLFTAKSLYMFRVSQHPSSWVLKTVTTASVQVIILVQLLPSTDQAKMEGSSCTDIMTCTGGCGYSFLYSWWWVLWHPKHVECFTVNKYLHTVASAWIFINIVTISFDAYLVLWLF